MRTTEKQWIKAFGGSLLCHGAFLGLAALLMVLFPAAPLEQKPIEVDLVAEAGGGGGGGGGGNTGESEELPKIHKAQATPTLPPPPTSLSEDGESAEEDIHSMADKAETTSEEMTDAGTSEGGENASSDGGSGSGSGSGHGSGIGTGTGSGYGPGSGSGSGGGSGSGIGTGNGSGYGPGSGDGSGGEIGPQALSRPEPRYPESARRAGIEGTTLVGMTISTDGSVTSAWVESSSGNGELDSAAVNAVYSWRFVPAQINGMAVTANSRVPIKFRLHQ